ncbi:probable cytochrome P450 313b1 isoform X3 [Drosophila nasuta]|uniref:probable cytochrome P450 313b1 isoform X3 n=1 Tax=Drosophila nasuta TaxID=42062 RepID=UPI00295F2B29|nr:probable cytochrome P450 313b1 isoform X3 [Drosophila nasuta]
MLVGIILASWLIIIWIYFLWTRRRYYKIAWQLRGPIGLPFIGLGLQMMNPQTFLNYMAGLSHKYKAPFISWMGTKCFLYVNDPQTVEQIFNSSHCTNKGDFYRFMSSAIGDGLFTSSSPRWQKHRRLINPAFSRQILCNFLPIFNAESEVLLDKLQMEGVQNGKSLEIYQILKKIVLEAACQTTMGKKMNFQHDGSMAIFEAYNGLLKQHQQPCTLPFYAWLCIQIIKTKSMTSFEPSCLSLVILQWISWSVLPTLRWPLTSRCVYLRLFRWSYDELDRICSCVGRMAIMWYQWEHRLASISTTCNEMCEYGVHWPRRIIQRRTLAAIQLRDMHLPLCLSPKVCACA